MNPQTLMVIAAAQIVSTCLKVFSSELLQSIVHQTKHDVQVSVLNISHLYIKITVKLDVCVEGRDGFLLRALGVWIQNCSVLMFQACQEMLCDMKLPPNGSSSWTKLFTNICPQIVPK